MDHLKTKIKLLNGMKVLILNIKISIRKKIDFFMYYIYLISRQFEKARPSKASKYCELSKEYTLIYIPEAILSPHFDVTVYIAKVLAHYGQNIIFVNCFNDLPLCIAKNSEGSNNQRKMICRNCSLNSLEKLQAYNISSLKLSDYCSNNELTYIESLILKAPKDLLTFECEGIYFGRLSLVDLVLRTKISNFRETSSKNRILWLALIKSSLVSYFAVSRLCAELNIKRLLYFNDYSTNLAARLAARKHEVPAITVGVASHKNIDFSKVTVTPSVWKKTTFEQLAEWPRWRLLCLPRGRVHAIGDDLINRLISAGSHQYSPPKSLVITDWHAKLALSPNKKTLVAYTSSLDENLAARFMADAVGDPLTSPPQPFEDQIDWLKTLVEHAEINANNIQLIVRVHPREGASRIDSKESEHLAKLKVNFASPPANVKFIWPSAAISSYDIAEIADIVLTSWSNIGLELARLGCPVLTSTNGVSAFPWDDFMEWAPTRDLYKEKLDFLLTRPLTVDQLLRSFRWYNLYHLGLSVDVEDIFQDSENPHLPIPFRLSTNSEILNTLIVECKTALNINIDKLIHNQSLSVETEELTELFVQVRRILYYLITGLDRTSDYCLIVYRNRSVVNATLRFDWTACDSKSSLDISYNNQTIHYNCNGKATKRRSVLIERLLTIMPCETEN